MRAGISGRRSTVAAVVSALTVFAGPTVAFPAPAWAVGGQRVLLVGDSVMVGATPAIEAGATAHGWAVTVDAKVGRTTTQGAAILRGMRALLPSVVVVELGNNDGGSPAYYHDAIDAVMTELAGVRRVVWYTITPFAAWVPAANAELAAAAHRWPNLELADWGSVSEQTSGALFASGPHLRPPGAQAFADLLYSTLDHGGAAMSVAPVVGSFSGGQPSFAMGAPQSGPISAAATALHGKDLWFVTPDGRVSARRGTPSFGSLAAPAAEPVVGMSATPTGRGYWLVASDGGIFGFGDAHYYGSTGGAPLNRPIVAMSSTPSGRGYWLVASDGGIFSFGDARFHGSTGGKSLRQPIVGMSSTTSGNGYWLVASDGGIFSFGDARFYGSAGGKLLRRPIVGMTSTLSGRGYWLAASDGGIFAFGAARFGGSGVALHAFTGALFIGIAPDAGGYQLAGFTIGGGT